MFIKFQSTKKSTAAGTLVDYIMSLALGTLLISAVCAFSFHSSRSFATFFNMVDADQANSRTINQMVRDLRMVNVVTNFSSTSVAMLDLNNNVLRYSYDSTAGTLKRVSGTRTNTMLRNLARFSFEFGQRNFTNGTFDFVPTTNTWECKAITAKWVSTRSLFGAKTEDMPQELTVVIRN